MVSGILVGSRSHAPLGIADDVRRRLPGNDVLRRLRAVIWRELRTNLRNGELRGACCLFVLQLVPKLHGRLLALLELCPASHAATGMHHGMRRTVQRLPNVLFACRHANVA
jgi:hypothetical protein